MAAPLALLSSLQVFIGKQRANMVRALLLMSIWGGALFGFTSLGEYALQQRLPPVQALAQQHALDVAGVLQGITEILDPLAKDPRLPPGLADDLNTESLDVRRALYEFGYLNRITNLYIWDETSGNIGQLASSETRPASLLPWLSGLAEAKRALGWLRDDEGGLRIYLAQHLADANNTHAYVVMPVGLNALQNILPVMPVSALLDNQEGSHVVVIGSDNKLYQFSRNLRQRPQVATWTNSVRLQNFDVVESPNSLTVTAPINGFPGWAVALPLASSMSWGTSNYAQYAVLGLAMLLSLLILWQPTRPIRRKIRQAMQPVIAIIQPLTAPVLASIAAVVSGQGQPRQPIQVNLNEPDPNDIQLSAPRRGKSMNLGTTTSKPHKTITPNYVPALKGSLRAAGEDLPDEAQAPNPEDTMAMIVDECFQQERTQLLYQPVYHARNGSAAMHEVLLRLIDREGLPMTPAVFIPICQKYGWMERLDAHVAKRVLDLNFSGGASPPTPLALNLSSDSMDGILYMEKLMQGATAAILSNIIFEVRSHELMQDPQALNFLTACRQLGVRMSVDYFGGGVGMVEASKKLGFDYIKMDSTRFSKDVLAKKELIMLCRAALKVELPIILEKMETVEMEVYARRIGVDYLQGYLLGKPKPSMMSGQLPGWREAAVNDLDEVKADKDKIAEELAKAEHELAVAKESEVTPTSAAEDVPPPASPDSTSK